jgi:hypothetical protein
MADTWDMSFLVDQATQIQEARGNLSRHFGMLQQVLIGKHLVNFIGDDDRLHFMRMMGRLSQRNWNEAVSVTFRTPVSGDRKLALQARPGSGPMAWWLLLSENGAESARPIAEVSEGDALASEDEFAAVASAASAGAGRPLDLSVFRAHALAVSPASAGLSAARHAELEQKIGETLIDTAVGGVVSRPEPGHYALMHEKDVPAQAIAGKLTETAAGAGVPAETLGLSHNTMPLTPDADADAMRDLMRNMRRNLSGRYSRKPGGFVDRMKSLVGMKLGA